MFLLSVLFLEVAGNDAAVGVTNEIQDIVTLGALRNLGLDVLASMSGVVATGIDEAIDILDVDDLCGGKAMTTKADRVDAHPFGRGTSNHSIRRNILDKARTTLNHAVGTDVGELMDQGTAAYNSKRINNHLTCHLNRIAHDDIVADIAVVSYVAIGHDHTVLANLGDKLGGSTAMHGNTFVQLGTVANLYGSIFALELEVLRYGGNTSTGEDVDILSDTSTGEYGDTVLEDGAITNHGVGIDTAEGADLDVFANLCAFFNIGERGNDIHTNYLFLMICAINSHSETILSPTNA